MAPRRRSVPLRPDQRYTPILFSDEDRKVAWRAMQNLQRLMPQMNHFAKHITGKPEMIVKLTTGVPGSKGGVISIRPPLGLGKDTMHDRSYCGVRDESARQICPACRSREVVEFFLFHEIAHAAFDTHVKPNAADRKVAEQFLKEWHPDSVCSHANLIRYRMQQKPDPLNYADALHPFLGTFFNAFEDPRVNLRMFDARPGMRTVFDLNLDLLINEGTEVGIGKYVTWAQAPLNSQFMVGLMYVASGRPPEGAFHSSVVEALYDSRIQNICARVSAAKDAHEIFRLAMEAFRVAQDLGFCLVEKCVPPPPSLGMPGDCTGGEGKGEPEESDPGEQPNQGDDSGDSGGGTDPGDESGLPSEGDPSAGEHGGADSGNDESTDNKDERDKPELGTNSEEGERDDPKSDSSTDESDTEGDDGSTDETGQDGSGGPDSENPDDDNDEPQESNDESEGSYNSNQDNNELDLGPSSKENQDRSDDGATEGSDEEDQGGNNGLSSGSGESITTDDDKGDSDGDERDSELESSGDHTVDDEGSTPETGEPEADEDIPEVKDEVADDPWLTEGPDTTGPQFEPSTMDGDVASPLSPEPGTPEDIARDLARFLMHGSDDHSGLLDQMADGDHEELVGISEDGELPERIKQIIGLALSQVEYFDTSSVNVVGVEIVPFPHRGIGWTRHYDAEDFAPSEKLMGAAVLHARRVFEDNKRVRHLTNLKSGRIDTRVLGKRAAMGDPRLFTRKIVPGKRDYLVVIGADCSGSTNRLDRNQKIKRAVHAQANLLSRLGVTWVGYGHTAYMSSLAKFPYGDKVTQYYVYLLPFKEERDAWDDNAKTRLANIVPVSDNLDGHTLEFYRKVAQRSTATDKVIIYYTDGDMPAANLDEEREILERELKTCERLGITVLGVGINTDSPSRYGMDTVRIDSDEDIHKVLQQLERRLAR